MNRKGRGGFPSAIFHPGPDPLCLLFSASLLLFLSPEPLNPETLVRRECERGEASASGSDDGGVIGDACPGWQAAAVGWCRA